MWYILTAGVCLAIGWFGKSYFGSLTAIEQAIVSEFRRFGTVTVTSPATGTTVRAVPVALTSDNKTSTAS